MPIGARTEPTVATRPQREAMYSVGPNASWNEAQRLATLDHYGILDTPEEPAFDDIASMIADLMCTSMAAISLVSDRRQWFKSEVGLNLRESPISTSVCRYAMLRSDALIVPDLSADARFACNPLVTGAPGLRFYAGEPLRTPDGIPLGALCVLDVVPRPQGLTDRQRFYLRTMARQVMDQLELRRVNAAVSALKDAQTEALRGSEHRARLALGAVKGVGVWQWDVASDRVSADPAIRALFGLDADAACTGLPAAAFFANLYVEDRPKLAAAHARVLSLGGDYEVIHRIVKPDGSWRWILNRGHALQDVAGLPSRLLAVAIDITEQRQLEAQLLQAQKMEAVGQLTGGIAHDFNNLLAGIDGAATLLRKRVAEGRGQEADRYLIAIRQSAARGASLTRRLLGFSRQQTLEPRPTDVNGLVAGMAELIGRSVGPTIVLDIVPAAAVCWVVCDPHQLENALLNLCLNSRDAMPGGGRLSVESSHLRLDDCLAAEFELATGDYVVLSVTDTGTGMPPAVAARVFEPFFTTKPIGQGTGLGLSMVYGFIRQSGGQARILSVAGQGTTVRLYLPRQAGDAVTPMAEAAVPSAVPRARPGERVLVVDDEATIRMLLTDTLRELGYTAAEAGDGQSALSVLRSAEPVDLLITDIGLPGMNGRELAEAALELRPALKVLFITGYDAGAMPEIDPARGGLEVIMKPFELEALARRVHALMPGASGACRSSPTYALKELA